MQSKVQITGLEELKRAVDGEVHWDKLHRLLYSQDASVYQEEPLGVAYPRSREDVQEICRRADELGISLIPRAAGTSLAGNCVGPGLVVDTGRHMNQILELNVEERWVRVQPGVILDELNRFLAPYGLFFGPDTSTANRCMIGGMIGNNSCGSHSILYGTTMTHVLELGVVFSDGEYELLEPWDEETLQEKMRGSGRMARGLRALDRIARSEAALIEERYPRRDVLRRNTGYPLDDIVARAPYREDGEDFSLARFMCGTEGTLGFVTEAKLNLVDKPKRNILVCAHFGTLEEALRATVEAVDMQPAAVELMDKRVLDLTKQNLEQARNRFWIEGDPAGVLVVEFYANTQLDLDEKAEALIKRFREKGLGYAYPIVHPPQDKAVWDVRKAGLGLLMGVEGDIKPVTVVEDTAVPVDVLPEYIHEFSQIMDAYGTACVYYAHASVGLLHLRPELNLKDSADVERFKGIARDVADLVKRYRGALSGEHGDGRVRSPLLERFYGPEIMALHREVKEAFDPNGTMNPAIIIDPKPIDEGFRFKVGAPTPVVKTFYRFEAEQGLVRAAELCNGAGVCRKEATAGGTMCPSYMATKDEKDSTRGRANVFRQVLTGAENPEEAFESEELKEALDLCLSCKGCKSECPANVDMARLKGEFLQHYYDRKGMPPSAWLFGNYGRMSRLGMIWPWFANFMLTFVLTRWIFNRFFGIAKERQMPLLASQTFDQAFRAYRKKHGEPQEGEHVWLYVDPFTDFTEPHVGIAAVEVLEAAGFKVERFMIRDDGRTLLSKGLIRDAKKMVEESLRRVAEALKGEPDRPVVGLEPSSLLTFRDEYLELASDEMQPVAKNLAERSYLLEDFLVERMEDLPEELWVEGTVEPALLQGHCHQRALVGTASTELILMEAGYSVESLSTGCCGMAGSFGYEADHYEVSMQIGELVLFPKLREADQEALVVAPGTSCRHQIADGVQREAVHTAVALARRLRR